MLLPLSSIGSSDQPYGWVHEGQYAGLFGHVYSIVEALADESADKVLKANSDIGTDELLALIEAPAAIILSDVGTYHVTESVVVGGQDGWRVVVPYEMYFGAGVVDFPGLASLNDCNYYPFAIIGPETADGIEQIQYYSVVKFPDGGVGLIVDPKPSQSGWIV